MNTSYELITEKFVQWAKVCKDIRAAHIIGSRAKGKSHPIWSDLDIEFYTTKPIEYRRNFSWIEEIATIWGIGPDDDGNKHQRWFSRFITQWTIFTILDGGLAVDFIIVHNWELLLRDWKARFLKQSPVASSSNVLFDKDGILSRVGGDIISIPPTKPPSQEHFLWVVHEFWGIADRATRKLGKGSLFESKRLIDIGLKNQIIEMLDWHTRCKNGWHIETGQKGRDLEIWADKRAVKGLQNAYAHYDLADMKRALIVTIELFSWLAKETADSLNYPYPEEMDNNISGWIIEHLPLIN